MTQEGGYLAAYTVYKEDGTLGLTRTDFMKGMASGEIYDIKPTSNTFDNEVVLACEKGALIARVDSGRIV